MLVDLSVVEISAIRGGLSVAIFETRKSTDTIKILMQDARISSKDLDRAAQQIVDNNYFLNTMLPIYNALPPDLRPSDTYERNKIVT